MGQALFWALGIKAVNKTEKDPCSSGAEITTLQIIQAGRLEGGPGRRQVWGRIPDF